MPYQGPGRYRHYRGNEYEVLGLALREATVRKLAEVWIEIEGQHKEENVIDVVYRPVGEWPADVVQVDFWTRRLKDFNGMVSRTADLMSVALTADGAKTTVNTSPIPRFQKIRPITALYFGTEGGSAGHFWHVGTQSGVPARGGSRAVRDWLDKHSPWGSLVDGKLYDERKQTQSECLIYHKDGWTAIAFANRIDDSRGACNGNFFFDTTLTFEQAVEEARKQFPRIMARIDAEAPLYLRQDQRGTVPA